MIQEPIPSPQPIDPHMIDRAVLLERFWRQQMGAPFASPVDIHIIRVADAAYMAGVSRKTIWDWMNAGIIPEGVYQRIGHLRWLHHDRFVQWLAEHPERQRRNDAA